MYTPFDEYVRNKSELTFGSCTKCGQHVSGHAVYVDGVLYCSYCELDTRHNKINEILKGFSG